MDWAGLRNGTASLSTVCSWAWDSTDRHFGKTLHPPQLGFKLGRAKQHPPLPQGSKYIVEYYSALKKEKILPFVITRMNLENTIVVLSLHHVWLFVTPWTTASQASLSFTIFWSLLKLMSIELVMPSNYSILCCHCLLLPSVFPSVRVFSSESALCIRWLKCWSFSFSISPSNEYSRLISFRIDSSKESILQCSAFFTVQLSSQYMTTGKAVALTVRAFVGKVKSLLFNMLSRFIIAFLPRRLIV